MAGERRSAPSDRSCPVRVITVGAYRRGELLHLSETGAEVEIDDAPSAGATVLLKWSSHERLCTVTWSGGSLCRMSFERSAWQPYIPGAAQSARPPDRFSASLSRIVEGRKRGRLGNLLSRQQSTFVWQVEIQDHRRRGVLSSAEAMRPEEEMFFLGSPLSHVVEYHTRFAIIRRSTTI